MLKEAIPLDTLQSVLRKDNYDVLRSFLRSQVGLEKLNWLKPEDEKCQITKFNALLNIDHQGIEKFMDKNASDENIISDKIKSNFNLTLEKLNQKKTPESHGPS